MNITDLKNNFFFSRPALITAGFGFVFILAFTRVLFSSEGVMSWGLQGFAMVFPVYLIASMVYNNFNQFGYAMLFLLSGGLYSAAIYYLSRWAEQVIERHKNRPRFEYKKVHLIH